MSKNRYSNFKIIAIKPLKGCCSDILKVLSEDTIYYFFNDYRVNENEEIQYNRSYPDGLYNARGLKLNFCAIAGKNGSGKSTLIELLIMAVNNIAYFFKMKSDLQEVKGLKVVLFIQSKTFFKVTIDEGTIEVQDFDKSGKLILENSNQNQTQVLKGLFYTICMNYSHYAYNYKDYLRKDQEDWLTPLFHKNDAYQTPLVINPWRDNGDIIIGRENSLVQSRLIANLLRPDEGSDYSFRRVTDNLQAFSLKLNLDKEKVYESEIYRGLNDSDDKKELISITYNDLKITNKDKVLYQINRSYNFNLEKYQNNMDEVAKIAMDYLIRKLVSISVKYDEYKGFFIEEQKDFDYKTLRAYIHKLTRDRSHIAFKFRQTLNFLKHRHIDEDPENLKLDKLSKKIQEVIDLKPNYRDAIIELIPPPIFTVDILLKPFNEKEGNLELKSLSSGEKQMIYSLSSILYHLFNLDSVSPITKTKVKYRTVQIILEEIELYFHPEMQRRYVKFLRESLIRLNLKDIRDINICFVTHSPFILSDIPNVNILFLQLKEGKAIQEKSFRKTFAANIHDLLADVFFMNEGVCGAFAIEQINHTIRFLNNCIKKQELLIKLKDDMDNKNIIQELELIEVEIDNESFEEHALLIDNIGESVLRAKLQEMYDDVLPEVSRRKKILGEIERLKKLL